jgi:predicted dehydrogenase
LRFKSGALGFIQAATSIWPGYPKTIAIHGDQGTAVIEQDDLLKWDFKVAKPEDDAIRARFAQKVGGSGGSSNPAAISHVGHARQLADFIEAIQQGRAPLVDGREGRKAVEVIIGAYTSNQGGKLVELKG